MRDSMNHGKYWSSSRYVDVVTANANVVTARNGPRMRSAGSPITTATPAATSTPAGMASK